MFAERSFGEIEMKQFTFTATKCIFDVVSFAGVPGQYGITFKLFYFVMLQSIGGTNRINFIFIFLVWIFELFIGYRQGIVSSYWLKRKVFLSLCFPKLTYNLKFLVEAILLIPLLSDIKIPLCKIYLQQPLQCRHFQNWFLQLLVY